MNKKTVPNSEILKTKQTIFTRRKQTKVEELMKTKTQHTHRQTNQARKQSDNTFYFRVTVKKHSYNQTHTEYDNKHFHRHTTSETEIPTTSTKQNKTKTVA